MILNVGVASRPLLLCLLVCAFQLDYRPDGEVFATAGRDCKVRIYEESTKTLLHEFSGG
jgi:WD40 repeat protein